MRRPLTKMKIELRFSFLDLGLGNEAVKAHLAGICGGFSFFFFILAPPGRRLGQADAFEGLHRGDRDQLVEGFFAEDLIDALAVSRDRRGYQHGVGGGMQFEMLFGMGESVVGDQRRDVGEFGGFGFEEFLASRGIEEEIADGDGGALGEAGFFDPRDFAAVDFEDGASGSFFCQLGGGAGFEAQARD